jgi:hypothetical protein
MWARVAWCGVKPTSARLARLADIFPRPSEPAPPPSPAQRACAVGARRSRTGSPAAPGRSAVQWATAGPRSRHVRPRTGSRPAAPTRPVGDRSQPRSSARPDRLGPPHGSRAGRAPKTSVPGRRGPESARTAAPDKPGRRSPRRARRNFLDSAAPAGKWPSSDSVSHVRARDARGCVVLPWPRRWRTALVRRSVRPLPRGPIR